MKSKIRRSHAVFTAFPYLSIHCANRVFNGYAGEWVQHRENEVRRAKSDKKKQEDWLKSSLNNLISIQKKEVYTNLEMATMLEIPEDTWVSWRSSKRKPQGPSMTLIKRTLQILKNGSVTRGDLLKKTGRI